MDIQLTKFANNKEMSDAVYTVLLNSFLEERDNQDVHVLAASRLAIDFLKLGWKEIEKHKTRAAQEGKNETNIGL